MSERAPGGWKPTIRPDGREAPVTVGVPRLTAYALSLFDLDVVARRTLRAMVGTGRVRRKSEGRYWRDAAAQGAGAGWSGPNVTSTRFQDALRLFERSGWIRRGAEYLLVRDRRGLLEYALHELEVMPTRFLDLEAAVSSVQEELARPEIPAAAVEQAHREMRELRRLMTPSVTGANRSGLGTARRVGPAGSGE